MKKRVNYLKVVALILMIVEIWMAIRIDKNAVKQDLNTWRLYCACIMCIPINVMFICAKRRVVK